MFVVNDAISEKFPREVVISSETIKNERPSYAGPLGK